MELQWKRFVFGLSVLLFGLLVLSTASRAEKGANWMAKGVNVSKSLEPKVQAEHSEKSIFRASFVMFKTVHMEYVCTKLELIQFFLLTEASGTGKVRYTGCEFIIEGAPQWNCHPEVNGEAGVIETEKLKTLIVLHKSEGGSTESLIRIEPSEGNVLAYVYNNKECGTTGAGFAGVAYIKDSNGQLGVEEVTHLFAIGPLTKVVFATEATPVTFSGTEVLGIGGSSWSGLPA